MGRLDVRQAVANTITAASLSYIGTVYPARPVVIEESDYVHTMLGQAIVQTADGSSAVVVVNMPSDKRERLTLTGRGAVNDFDKHIVALEIFFASTGGDGVAAQFDYDLIIDELVELIRENPTMSAPAAVWSAGEYTYGVQHEQGQAFTSEDGLQILIPGLIRFQAWEQVVGPIPLPPD